MWIKATITKVIEYEAFPGDYISKEEFGIEVVEKIDALFFEQEIDVFMSGYDEVSRSLKFEEVVKIKENKEREIN